MLELTYPSIAELNKKNPPPAIYYLYLPKEIYAQSNDSENQSKIINMTCVKGDILVDMSHGNAINPWILDSFSKLVTEEGMLVGYSDNWSNIKNVLNETKH